MRNNSRESPNVFSVGQRSDEQQVLRSPIMEGLLGRSYPKWTYEEHASRNQEVLGLVQQINNDRDDFVRGEERQALSLVVNRLPSPPVHPSEITTVAGLLSAITRKDQIKSEAKGNHVATDRLDDDVRRHAIGSLRERENANESKPKRVTTQLHKACRLVNPFLFVNELVTEGASVNQTNSRGQTPLHILILGGVRNQSAKDALECLLWRGASVSSRDDEGETPLICVKYLLQENHFEIASHVATALLNAGADVNDTDNENQTLLSYSLQYLDSALPLTRTLFNYGATLWGHEHPAGDDSAFRWLLKSIMEQRKLINCNQTINLVGQLMSNHPTKMASLIIRTMMRHSKCYQVYGPVFLGIQTKMKIYWRQPQRLSQLCRLTIRANVRNSPVDSVPRLCLPQTVQNYLLLKDDSFGD